MIKKFSKINSIIQILCLFFSIILFVNTSKATEFSHWSKDQLDYFCNSSSDMEKALCLGYVTGSLETITSALEPENKGIIPSLIPCGKKAVYKYRNFEWMEFIKIEVKRSTYDIAILTIYETVGKYGC